MVNMKKISMIALTILTLGVTSCDMDKMPYDAVPTEEALTTIVGFEEARAGIYSVYLGLTGGSYVLAPEVQADAFNAVADFSNKYGELHRWTFESTNSTVETIWSNYYAAIGRVNFFIDGVGKIDENPEIELTETQRQQINVYEGEAYFTRAYCYFYLATLFCRDYDVATAASTPGLPLQVKYEPKLSATQYPGRSSLEDTYKQILEDLEEAEERIETAKNGIADYDFETLISDAFDILARYAVGCLFIEKNQFDFKNLAQHYIAYRRKFLDTMMGYIRAFIEQGTVRPLEHLELSTTLIIEILSWWAMDVRYTSFETKDISMDLAKQICMDNIVAAYKR